MLSSTTLSLIHHLVYEYYTTYANIIKLYLPNDISKLLKKQSLSSPSKAVGTSVLDKSRGAGGEGLVLIIMPDRRTIINQQEQY
jgi:hypothetical protein